MMHHERSLVSAFLSVLHISFPSVIHIVEKRVKRLNSASLQRCFVVAYSSGDLFIFFTLYMKLYIHVLSNVIGKPMYRIFIYLPMYVAKKRVKRPISASLQARFVVTYSSR